MWFSCAIIFLYTKRTSAMEEKLWNYGTTEEIAAIMKW